MKLQNALISFFLFPILIFGQHRSFNSDWEFIGREFTNEKDLDSLRKLGDNFEDQFRIKHTKADKSDLSSSDTILKIQLKFLKNPKWNHVNLPHIAFPEPLPVKQPREGIAWYKKTFTIEKKNKGKAISLYFEGVMQVADIWINGKYIERHYGGYLPFGIDISNLTNYGKKNTIYIKVNNQANPIVPPGKPVENLDFIYYSGIYRNVWLNIKDPLHITEAMTAGKVAGGGVFVTYPKVSKKRARINIKTHIKNESNKASLFKVEQILENSKGDTIGFISTKNNRLSSNTEKHYHQELVVKKPNLWFPNKPYLYRLKTVIRKDAKIVDEKVNKIGIRSVKITKQEGVLINDKPIKIVGTNRHESYPYVGGALSEKANYRDAWLIKNAGLNAVRTGHYPAAPSFIKAADELGLLVIEPVPGWQYFNTSKKFLDNAFKDIRKLIRRDRNHPSILLWEASLNEAYPSAKFRCMQVAVANSEWIGKKNFFTSGDSYFQKACYDVPYDDWNGNPGDRNNTTYPDNPFLIREYGDYEFGGNNSTSRQVRSKGMDGLLQQAWNLQWEHNKNLKKYPRAIGDLNWSFYDGLAGLVVGREGWGLVDIFRIPKFSYFFFQSQRSPEKLNNTKVETGPMLKIAHYWNHTNKWNNVVVYSNTDKVALYVNDSLIAKQEPDAGPETEYGNDFKNGGNPFDGGNANNLNHPPFTFKDVPFAKGKLKAVGYLDGKPVVSDEVNTPGKAFKLQIQIAENGRPLQEGEDDVVFVYVRILDDNGNLVINSEKEIKLVVKGKASIESPIKINAEAGIATFLIRTHKTENLELEASSGNLSKAYKEFF